MRVCRVNVPCAVISCADRKDTGCLFYACINHNTGLVLGATSSLKAPGCSPGRYKCSGISIGNNGNRTITGCKTMNHALSPIASNPPSTVPDACRPLAKAVLRQSPESAFVSSSSARRQTYDLGDLQNQLRTQNQLRGPGLLDLQRAAGQGDAKAHYKIHRAPSAPPGALGGTWGCGFCCAFASPWPAARCKTMHCLRSLFCARS